MKLKINAIDTLFFRDGRPNILGEDSWSDTLFPPNPSVLYGALRSSYFASHPEFLAKANTIDDPTKDLQINSCYLYKGLDRIGDSLIPTPLDCIKISDEKAMLKYNPSRKKGVQSFALPYLNVFNDQIKSVEGTYLSDIEEYFTEETDEEYHISSFEKLITTEYKIGIALDKQSRSTRESMLYRIEQVRLRNKEDIPLAIFIDTNFNELFESNISDNLILRLGGEGKTVKADISFENTPIPVPKIESTYFKLVLLTPAIFNEGWLPEAFFSREIIDERGRGIYQGRGIWKDIPLKLVGAYLGKFKSIGGFNIKERCPKPMYRTVPAGSVYYFKIEDNTSADKIIAAFHQKNISEQLAEQGFGHAVLASLNKLPL